MLNVGNQKKYTAYTFLNFCKDAQGNCWFATDLQVCKQTSDGDARTGTFHQMPITPVILIF